MQISQLDQPDKTLKRIAVLQFHLPWPSTKALEAHHRTYARLGKELPRDVEILCDSCHERTHGLSAA